METVIRFNSFCIRTPENDMRFSTEMHSEMRQKVVSLNLKATLKENIKRKQKYIL